MIRSSTAHRANRIMSIEKRKSLGRSSFASNVVRQAAFEYSKLDKLRGNETER